MILRGPDPERDGISAHTREDLAGLIRDRFGKRHPPASLGKALRRMGRRDDYVRYLRPPRPGRCAFPHTLLTDDLRAG